jgi:hypothetical protein
MNVAAIVARILLGMVFLAAGLAGFAFYARGTAPPMPGLGGDFMAIYFKSGWIVFVNAIYVVVATMLLINRFVPLALTVLAGIIVNILIFHLTMNLVGIGPGLVVAILWFLVAWPIRAHFAPLLTVKA